MTTADKPLEFRGRRPTALSFGTSGLRGLVSDITDLEAYINTRGFLDYLFQIGDAQPGKTISIAGDLRPSTDSPSRSIMRAVARAIEDAGLEVENLGTIPTPALACYALANERASVMVTGSHIPFDRNGIKFSKKSGEVLKEDEPGILAAVAEVREREYLCPPAASLFDDDGMFKSGEGHPLPPARESARKAYLKRYLDFFPTRGLAGKRIVFFQHSAVGRDLLVELFDALGAEVHPAGRSEEFIAIDTEDVTEERLRQMQEMIDDVSRRHGSIDALASTDGDSDRPLLVGVGGDGRAKFFGGDLLGIVVAEYLNADGVAVPVSANDAVDLQLAKRGITPTKTAIGSPYVIRGMQEVISIKKGQRVVGWEANGGFMTGTDIEKGGRTLAPLPTRDAALPIVSALFASIEHGSSLVDLFSVLPPRFSKAGLIDHFPQETGRTLIQRFTPEDQRIQQMDISGDEVAVVLKGGQSVSASRGVTQQAQAIRKELGACFDSQHGFGDIIRINVVDGVRITFSNGDIAHIRPSGNAPQLRIYAVAGSQARADDIVRMGIHEPDGLLRQLESTVQRHRLS